MFSMFFDHVIEEHNGSIKCFIHFVVQLTSTRDKHVSHYFNWPGKIAVGAKKLQRICLSTPLHLPLLSMYNQNWI